MKLGMKIAGDGSQLSLSRWLNLLVYSPGLHVKWVNGGRWANLGPGFGRGGLMPLAAF